MEKEDTPGKKGLTRIDSLQLRYILPSPDTYGNITLEKVLSHRRSHRSFLKNAIVAEDLSQILWAAYGITRPLQGYSQMRGGLRTVPSAGATYPLELYALIGDVKNIKPGVYRYLSQTHEIIRIIDRDIKKELSTAAYNQEMISNAPACLFYSAIFSRSTKRYGDRGYKRYVCMDLGHSAQNVYLQAEALNIGTCAIGAFDDLKVKEVMKLPDEEEPLYIMPIGKYHNISEI
jgi:SagB-type dehydrogenase family enzyme